MRDRGGRQGFGRGQWVCHIGNGCGLGGSVGVIGSGCGFG